MTDRVPVARTPAEQAEEDAFQALYGEWAPMTPVDVAREMVGFERPWWVAKPRPATGDHEHPDVDTRVRVPAFVEFMRGRWHVWNTSAASCTLSATTGHRR